MNINLSYKVKIKNYSHIFNDTLKIYREAVEFLIGVCTENYDTYCKLTGKNRNNYLENLIHTTKSNKAVYPFDNLFYKFPTYLRRSALQDAMGLVNSYKSNLINNPKTSKPHAGRVFPCLYHSNMFKKEDDTKARIKIYHLNDWIWLDVYLKRSDVSYIQRHCSDFKESSPYLIKKGKEWFLSFSYSRNVLLKDTISRILAVDLGINNAATVSIMNRNGTVLSRKFLSLDKEYDHLSHSLNRVKKARQNGNYSTPRLWAKVNGINKDISSKTAIFIIDEAILNNVDLIVFEHLDTKGRKKGSRKEILHLWKKAEVIKIVTNRAHREGIRISTVFASGTSRYAYDGSGKTERGTKAHLDSYSLCRFQTGKIYNADLNASYNIGARYFIREILKSLDENSRLSVLTEVSELGNRSTCTLSTLINLYAVCKSLSFTS